MADTGFPAQDAQFDFSRARRRRVLSRLVGRLRGEPSDVSVILPFDEVVLALGRRGEREVGLETIELDSIVGTVDRSREFDRGFLPTTNRARPRWERIATAQRRGESMPPISVYRVGELHFVRDGHHRVSVARATGIDKIDAYVTEVLTRLGADRAIRLADLPLKDHERLFDERVPLAPDARARIQVSEPEWQYGDLAEAVEAWAFRVMQARREFVAREEAAEGWFREDYVPIVEALRDADMLAGGTETERYMRVTCDRYRLLRTHDWDERVLEELRRRR
jgi:hypothetical protein